MSNRVIFIAGANFSGSTLLGCILGSHPQSPYSIFHVGEVYAFFTPQHSKYGKANAAIQSGGAIWKEVDYSVGVENAYSEIFIKSESNVIIDSSKNINWLQSQYNSCNRNSWPFHILVSYRPFDGIWNSGKNRGLEIKRNLSNIMYYHRLFSEIQNMKVKIGVVNIPALIKYPQEITQKICTAVDLQYFDGKEKYWNFNHYHLYGSSNQRKQIKDPQNANFYQSSYAKNIIQNVPLNSNQMRLLEEAKYFLKSRLII